jgi:hypothetical protein
VTLLSWDVEVSSTAGCRPTDRAGSHQPAMALPTYGPCRKDATVKPAPRPGLDSKFFHFLHHIEYLHICMEH